MKKLWIICLGLLMGTSVFAQEGLHIGLGGIGQNTWITNAIERDASVDEFSYKTTFGYGGYGSLGYNFVDPIGIHVGLMYSVQGQRNNATDTAGTKFLAQRRLTYLKVPVSVRFSSEVNNAMFYFGGGAYWAKLLEAEHLQDGTPVEFGYPTADRYNPTEWGFQIYVGTQINLYNEVIWFTADAWLDRSLNDIENKDYMVNNSPIYDPERAKSLNLNIGLRTGLLFTIPIEGGGGGQYWIR